MVGIFEVIQRCASYAEGLQILGYLVRRPACASQLGEKERRLEVLVGIAGYIYTYAGWSDL